MSKRVELIRGTSKIRVIPEHVESRKSTGWKEKPRPRTRRTKPQKTEGEVDE